MVGMQGAKSSGQSLPIHASAGSRSLGALLRLGFFGADWIGLLA